MFGMNCLTYALFMSGKFDNTVIENIKIDCYKRYIPHKDLDKLGRKYNIAFKVVKYREDKKQFDDITKGNKTIGSKESNAIKIDLALIHDHYICIINEFWFNFIWIE